MWLHNCNLSVNAQSHLPKRGIQSLTKLILLSIALITSSAVQASPDASIYSGKKEISEMNILLPVSLCTSTNPGECRDVRHELSASNGCYTWQISHPQLISMKPKHTRGECVDSVTLQSLIHRESKTLIWITATDKSSGQILESQAKVGIIDRLAINTNYRFIYINDKKHVEVAAYDDEGNIFSGLHGFRFDWSIVSGSENLKIISKPEGYHHKHSNGTEVTHLKGLKEGAAELKVHMLEPGYEHISSVQVTIQVVDPFVIEPEHLVYILPTSAFDFKLSKLRKHDNGHKIHHKRVSLPDPQYQWSVPEPVFGQIQQNGRFVSGMTEGVQTILVVDQNMVNNTAETEVHVVYPYKLRMSIHDVTSQETLLNENKKEDLSTVFGIPLDRQSESNILVENHLYLIILTLFDKDGNQITLTDNVLMESQSLLDQPWIEQIRVNKIGSEILFRTRQIQGPIQKMPTAYFLKQIKSDSQDQYELPNSARLLVEVELLLTKPVKIMHPTETILLPYLFGQGQVQETSAQGGSGIYTWSVENQDIVSVEGSVTIKSLRIGKTRLVVQDHKNLKNRASIEVEVAKINQLKWLEEQMELKAESTNAIFNVIALDRQGRKFSNCSSVKISYVTKGEPSVILLQQQTQVQHTELKQFLNQPAVKQLLILRQKFDENPDKVYQTELPQSTRLSEDLMIHNNFGICTQVQIQTGAEGLGRLRSIFASEDPLDAKVIESEFAEIAVYKPLTTTFPDVSSFFNDLYSKSQIGQEFQNFDQFFQRDQLNLLTGTEMIWSVTGGTNFWKDYSDKYLVDWKVDVLDSSQNSKCLEVRKEQFQTTKFEVKIRCLATSDLNSINKMIITMNQSSKLTRHLLQPASHSVQLKVECGAPRSARLLWSQPSKSVEVFLPVSRIQDNVRVSHVLAGSRHQLKTLLLDADSNSYLNSSSIIQKVSSSDKQLAVVSMPETTFEISVSKDNYAKTNVQFSNQTGFVVLQSEVVGYQNSILQIESSSLLYSAPKDTSEWNRGYLTQISKSVSDSVRVQIVRKHQVEPAFKSLYIGTKNTFKLAISEGSGHFSVSLDNQDLAEVIHKEREILINPRQTGLLELKIEDIEVPGSEACKVQVLISDIEKILLWSPRSLIEQGDEMNLIVSAFDSNGNDFDIDQYADMIFTIETEMTGVIRQYGLQTQSTEVNSQFLAHGVEPGIYQLTAYTRRIQQKEGYSMSIVSEMMRIEVFPHLDIFPGELLLTPNMKYTLQINGGPQTSVQSFLNGSSIEIKFDIEESDIAIVDQNREVTGLQVGDATLRYQIIQQRTQRAYLPRGVSTDEANQASNRVVSKKRVPIRVRFVTDIEIPLTNQRLIYSGSLVKFNAVLKFGTEYFNHGIAPISYSWNCSAGRTLSLELPTDSLMSANILMQKTKRLRNNKINEDNALFTTSFNSSTIYATAGKEGDAQVQVLLAIEYPSKYQTQINWFMATATVKVASQLKIKVNEFSTASSEGTHMFLLPPNTIGYIKTNINSVLKLGYSLVSVYDHSTNQYKSEEATTPIVKLIENKAIQTFEKYGKVTVVVEQGGQSFSDQVAMLNVFISDIYSIQIMNTYDALFLPLGSTLQLPIHFQNEHANRFADNVEGIKIGFSLSHPKVVQVQIDSFAQKLTILTHGSGDCNILVYLENFPHIFDIIKVRVSSIVRPLSPVYLHIGGQVDFKVINTDDSSQKQFEDQNNVGTQWKSSDSSILQIGLQNGNAIGYSEGRAEVMLSNHVNAASIVHVGRIVSGQIESKNALVLNTDETVSAGRRFAPEDLRVRVKLYLSKNGEEVMPTTHYDGVILIRQNVGIRCASDQPDFVNAVEEISDMEGYFCVLKYKQNADHKSMPRFVKITVHAYSLLPGSATPSYSEQVAQFEVQLLSSIKVENKFKNGVSLTRNQRLESVHIFSSSDFNVQIEYENSEASDDQIYLKHKVTRADVNSNDYNLTLIVPVEVTKDFKANIVLTHPYTKFQRILPVTFQFRSDESVAPRKAVKGTVKQPDPDYENMPKRQVYDEKSEGRSWSSYLAIFLVIFVSVAFLLQNWAEINIFYYLFPCFAPREGERQRYQRASRSRPMEMNYGNGVREPVNRSFPRKNLNYSQSSYQNTSILNQSPVSAADQRRPRQLPNQGGQGLNLDGFQARSGLDRSGGDPSRISLYSNTLDLSGR